MPKQEKHTNFFNRLANVAKNSLKTLSALIVAIIFLSLIIAFYSLTPVHSENKKGNTDYVWQPNSIWIKMTEGITYGVYDAQGFNNITVIDNPDILVLGSSHMEATNVLQNENAPFLLGQLLKDRYTVYNLGISGHNFYKICQYLPTNLELYKTTPKVTVIEASTVNITHKNIEDITNKRVKHTKSYDTGIIGMMQKVPFFRLLYQQFYYGLGKIFIPPKPTKIIKKTAEPNVDTVPYNDLFKYLHSIEEKYGTQIIIVYHPTGKIEKDGSILFKPSEQKKLFKKTAEENKITFVDLTKDFEMMYYKEHHVAHGFATGKLESGHLNRYGHTAMAKALYNTINSMEKDGEICK